MVLSGIVLGVFGAVSMGMFLILWWQQDRSVAEGGALWLSSEETRELLRYGLAGSLTGGICWWSLCRRERDRWWLTGIAAGVLFSPMWFLVGEFLRVGIVKALHSEGMPGILFLLGVFSLYTTGIFSIPAGIVASRICLFLLTPPLLDRAFEAVLKLIGWKTDEEVSEGESGEE